MSDRFNLERFVEAQAEDYGRAVAELRAGRKQSHWMWYIFPQIAGLGVSAMSQKYAIGSIEEARAYLAHPLLGPRLVECMRAVIGVEGRSAHEILGAPDDVKLQSCATLFAAAAPDEDAFEQVLEKYYSGQRDSKTLELLGTTHTR